MTRRIQISMLLTVCFILLACGPSLKSAKWSERQEAVRRLEPADQAILADVALRDPIIPVRQAAIEKITDPAILERVAITDDSNEVRTKAVMKLSDQAALARVAVGNSGAVGEAAVAKLTDPKALERVAIEGKGLSVAGYAQRKLPKPLDPALLTRMALEAKEASVRESAVDKVTDQAVLVKVALTDRESGPRRAAAAHLTDQAALSQVLLGDKDDGVRQAALPQVTDQAVLAKVALADTNARLRKTAVDQLKDPALLGQVALTSPDSEAAWAAVTNLNDQETLMKVAAGTSSDRLLEHVLERLSPESKRTLAETFYRKAAAENTESAYRRFIARFPGTAQAEAASDMINRKRFEALCAIDTCSSYAAFLAESPSGPYSAEARRRLAAKGQWEKAKRLGELAIDMLPLMVSVPYSGQMYPASPLAESALKEFRIMLEAGADPRAVRIAGDPVLTMKGQGRFVNGVGFVFGRYEGGIPVPEEQSGIPLVQFLEARKLTEALRLIQSHATKAKRR
jgi:hypothetical protein